MIKKYYRKPQIIEVYKFSKTATAIDDLKHFTGFSIYNCKEFQESCEYKGVMGKLKN